MAKLPIQIFVLTMHRSGSSALMSLIEAMGAFVGKTEEVLPAAISNPRGFGERQDVHKACGDMMRRRGAHWADLSNLRSRPFDNPTIRETWTIRKILNRIGRDHTSAIKDPMMCFALPAFAALSNDPRLIVLLRHPIEIARSLHVRNGFAFEHSLSLWENYMARAICHSRNYPTTYISHDKMTRDPGSVVLKLEKVFGGNGLSSIPLEKYNSLIDQSLINHRVLPNDEIKLTSGQQKLWSNLQSFLMN